MTDKAIAPEGENTMRRIPSSHARRWVQPKNMSDTIATGGEGWDLNHSIRGPWSSPNDRIMARNESGGKSLTFSTPGGIAGCEGNGKTSASIEG